MALNLPDTLLQQLRDHRQRSAEDAALRLHKLQHHQISDEENLTKVANNYAIALYQTQDDVERAYDAFLLDPGMGPALYITADGRILEDGRCWDGAPPHEVLDEDTICAALTIGAHKTGISALIELLPTAPSNAVDCPCCEGTRWSEVFGSDKMICVLCRGRGWATNEMIAQYAQHYPLPAKP